MLNTKQISSRRCGMSASPSFGYPLTWLAVSMKQHSKQPEVAEDMVSRFLFDHVQYVSGDSGSPT